MIRRFIRGHTKKPLFRVCEGCGGARHITLQEYELGMATRYGGMGFYMLPPDPTGYVKQQYTCNCLRCFRLIEIGQTPEERDEVFARIGAIADQEIQGIGVSAEGLQAALTCEVCEGAEAIDIGTFNEVYAVADPERRMINGRVDSFRCPGCFRHIRVMHPIEQVRRAVATLRDFMGNGGALNDDQMRRFAQLTVCARCFNLSTLTEHGFRSRFNGSSVIVPLNADTRFELRVHPESGVPSRFFCPGCDNLITVEGAVPGVSL